MTDHIDELAGLPKDVREAIRRADAGFDHTGLFDEPAWKTIRAELLRLDRECQDRIRQALENGQRAERAEVERDALKRMIAEAPTAHIDQEGISVCDTLRDIGYYRGQRVALLPVGELVTEQDH